MGGQLRAFGRRLGLRGESVGGALLSVGSAPAKNATFAREAGGLGCAVSARRGRNMFNAEVLNEYGSGRS
jgi:hypothetical protein